MTENQAEISTDSNSSLVIFNSYIKRQIILQPDSLNTTIERYQMDVKIKREHLFIENPKQNRVKRTNITAFSDKSKRKLRFTHTKLIQPEL